MPTGNSPNTTIRPKLCASFEVMRTNQENDMETLAVAMNDQVKIKNLSKSTIYSYLYDLFQYRQHSQEVNRYNEEIRELKIEV